MKLHFFDCLVEIGYNLNKKNLLFNHSVALYSFGDRDVERPRDGKTTQGKI